MSDFVVKKTLNLVDKVFQNTGKITPLILFINIYIYIYQRLQLSRIKIDIASLDVNVIAPL